MGHLITMQGHSGKDKHSVGPPDFHFVTRDIIQGLRVPDGGLNGPGSENWREQKFYKYQNTKFNNKLILSLQCTHSFLNYKGMFQVILGLLYWSKRPY